MKFRTLLACVLSLAWIGTTGTSTPAKNTREEKEFDTDKEIYNEIIDERPAEERASPAERQKKFLDNLGKTLRNAQKTPQSPAEAPARQQKQGTPPASSAKSTDRQSKATSPGVGTIKGSKEAVEVDGRPTLGILVSSPDMLVEQQMVVRIRLDNPNRVPYDAVAFAIQYDPVVLEILDGSVLPGINVSDASAAALGLNIQPVDKYYINEVDSAEGLILFQARLQSEQAQSVQGGIIAQFTVRAIRERGETSLQFENVLQGGAIDDVLKLKNLQERPACTYLRMLDKNNKEQVLNEAVLEFGARLRVLSSQEDFLASEEVEDYLTALRLLSGADQVRVGEQFDVFVLLNNPDQVAFDEISLYLRYDARVLRVVDTDDNNWITEGVNISDGEYHDAFPLEYCKANRVDVHSGEITYAMKSFGEPINGSGTIARIRFEAVRAVETTYVLFGFNLPNRFPTTGLFRRQQDVLAKSSLPRDGVSSNPIKVLP